MISFVFKHQFQCDPCNHDVIQWHVSYESTWYSNSYLLPYNRQLRELPCQGRAYAHLYQAVCFGLQVCG